MPAAGFAIDLLPGRGLQRGVPPARLAQNLRTPWDTVGRRRRGRSRLVRRLRPAGRGRRRAATRRSRRWSAARLLADPGGGARGRRPSRPRQPDRGAPRRPARGQPARAPPLPGAVVTGNPIRPAIAAGARGRRSRRRWSRWSAGASAPARSTGAALGLYDRWRDRSDVAIHHVERRARLRRVPASGSTALRAPGRPARLPTRPVRGAHGGHLRRRRRWWCPASGGMTAELAAVGVPVGAGAAARARRATTRPRNAEALARGRRGGAGARRRARRRPPRRRARPRCSPTPTRSAAMGDAARGAGPPRRRRPVRRPRRGGRRCAADLDRRPRPRPRPAPRAVHIVGVGGAGMSAIATVLAAHGPPRRAAPTCASRRALERLGLLGVTTHVGHDAEQPPGRCSTRSSSRPRSPRATPRSSRPRERGIPVLRRADALRAIVATRTTDRGRGQPRQDHDVVDARADPARRRAGTRASSSAATSTRSAPTRCATRASGSWSRPTRATARSSSSRPTTRSSPTSSPTTSTTTATSPRSSTRSTTLRRRGARASCALCADDELAAAIAAARPARPSPTGSPTAPTTAMTSYEGGRSGTPVRARPRRRAARAWSSCRCPGRTTRRTRPGAAAIALELGVPFDAVARALGGFGGVARRFQFRGERDGVTFVDDYAHLPSEVAAMIRAAREGGWERVVAVFQPHRYTRTAALWRDFADAFVGADVLVLTDVYPAGERRSPGCPGGSSLRAVLDAHPEQAVVYLPAPRRPRRPRARASPAPGDLVLTLGAGDLTTAPDEWLARAPVVTARRAPASRPPSRLAARSRRGCRAPVERDVPVAELTTYRVGGPAAVLVRVESPRDARPRSPRSSPSGVAAAARRRAGLEPARRRRRVRRARGRARRRVRDDRPRRRAAAPCGPARRCRCRCSPPARRRGRSRRARVLRRHPRQRRRRGAHERRRPRRETADVLVDGRRRRPGAPARRPGPCAGPPPTSASATGARRSRPTEVVTGAELPRRRRRPVAECEATIAEIVRWRREHQPGGANAGSVFANPPGDSAGRLIDALRAQGPAGRAARSVSAKHANFFQAEAGATADDVHALVVEVRRRVRDATGIALVPELRLVGFDDAGPGGRGDAVTHPHAGARPTRPATGAPPPRPAPTRAGVATRRARADAGVGWRSSCGIVVVLAALAWGVTVSPLLDVDHVQVRGHPPPHRGRGRARPAGIHPGDAMAVARPGRVGAATSRRCRGCGGPRSAASGPTPSAITVRERRPVAWVDGPTARRRWSTAPGGCSRRWPTPPVGAARSCSA